jgi:hypothetical protein
MTMTAEKRQVYSNAVTYRVVLTRRYVQNLRTVEECGIGSGVNGKLMKQMDTNKNPR